MKKAKRVLIGLCAVLILTLTLGIWFSPFGHHDGYDYPLIVASVEINAPVDSVFRYLGNSRNAEDWSVFVDHIRTLNDDSVPDGTVGSIRRAFCRPDETGQRWDEVTTIVENNRRRQLISYNYVDFSITAEGLATEQVYESLGPAKTKLSFTLFYLQHRPSLFEKMKTYYAAYTVKDIFERNINNVKYFVERKQ